MMHSVCLQKDVIISKKRQILGADANWKDGVNTDEYVFVTPLKIVKRKGARNAQA
jgi:hypothetical protein